MNATARNKPIAFRPSNKALILINAHHKQYPKRSRAFAVNALLETLADGQSEQPSGADKPISNLMFGEAYPPRLACPIIGRYVEAKELLPKCEDCIRKQQGTCGAWQSI